MSDKLKKESRRAHSGAQQTATQEWTAVQHAERLLTDGKLASRRYLRAGKPEPRGNFTRPETAPASGPAAEDAAKPLSESRAEFESAVSALELDSTAILPEDASFSEKAPAARTVNMRSSGASRRRAAAVSAPQKTEPAAQADRPVGAIPPATPVSMRTAGRRAQAAAVMERAPAAAAPAEADEVSGALLEELRAKLRRIPRRWRQIVGEKQASRFPESNRALIQFLLFAWSMLPMLGGVLREHTWGRRKRVINRFAHARSWFERKGKLRPAVFLSVAGAVAVVALFFSFYTFGTTVSYDGTVVASVSSRLAAWSACSDLEKVTAKTLSNSYTIDNSLLQYSSGLLRRQDVVNADTLEEDLSDEIGLVTYGYGLYVDGELVGATPYEGALEELLHQLKNSVTDENTISCDFQEDVEIRAGYVPTEKIMNLGYLAQQLYSTKTQEVTYTVQSGDTWSEIAESHGMTSAELLTMNPGYDISRLAIGEVLTLSAAVPYLTLTVTEQERYVEDIPYEVSYTDSAYLYQGDYKVTSAGVYGKADVVANVTYVNGTETERSILSSVTLTNPVTEQQVRGTKERPSWSATGTFRWPCSGNITSRFGYRTSPGGIGSTNHKGIDIANRKGTAVCAADGGTVIYAGWMSGYGYLVQIDHGNGYVTCYGHNSRLLVSVGQHVYKGQQIAKMGSTGNSTGNHCHFEVRYNGVPKNPLNYLP